MSPVSTNAASQIRIRGARTHNLRGIDVDDPARTEPERAGINARIQAGWGVVRRDDIGFDRSDRQPEGAHVVARGEGVDRPAEPPLHHTACHDAFDGLGIVEGREAHGVGELRYRSLERDIPAALRS